MKHGPDPCHGYLVQHVLYLSILCVLIGFWFNNNCVYILSVHRAKSPQYIRAVTWEKVFILYIWFSCLTWITMYSTFCLLNSSFSSVLIPNDSAFFHCIYSWGVSSLIKMTVCFIKYIVPSARSQHMWVTMTTRLLGDSGCSVKFAAVFYEALLSLWANAGFMCVTGVLIFYYTCFGLFLQYTSHLCVDDFQIRPAESWLHVTMHRWCSVC